MWSERKKYRQGDQYTRRNHRNCVPQHFANIVLYQAES
jgi:hypothetical protein